MSWQSEAWNPNNVLAEGCVSRLKSGIAGEVQPDSATRRLV